MKLVTLILIFYKKFLGDKPDSFKNFFLLKMIVEKKMTILEVHFSDNILILSVVGKGFSNLIYGSDDINEQKCAWSICWQQ